MGFFSGILGNAFGSVVSSVGGSLLDKFTGGSSGGSGLDIGSLVGAGSNLLGGFLSSKSTEDANEANIALAREQMAYQRELAQNQMQWRVEDAKKAGMHPMAALGLSSMSYSPVSSNVMPTDYSYIGDMGQNINRAIMQGKTAKERQQALDRQDQFDRIALRKANADADYAETLAASERLKLQRELFPPAPVSNATDKKSDTFFNFGDAPLNLYSMARVGDVLLTVLNPDIADSLTESQIAHLSATLAREMEVARNPKVTLDAFKQLSPASQKAVADGRAVFEYVPAVGGYMLTYRKRYSKGNKEVSGALRFD